MTTDELDRIARELDQARHAIADLVGILLPAKAGARLEFVTARQHQTLAVLCPDALAIFEDLHPPLEQRSDPGFDVHDQGRELTIHNAGSGWPDPFAR